MTEKRDQRVLGAFLSEH